MGSIDEVDAYKEKEKMKNTWSAKIKRTITCLLPISKDRKGECISCGECCKLPTVCPFLGFKDNKSYCKAYPIRPVNCRKYPRTKEELITEKTCGFSFTREIL
jgi:Fe-S-cluster containining protein